MKRKKHTIQDSREALGTRYFVWELHAHIEIADKLIELLIGRVDCCRVLNELSKAIKAADSELETEYIKLSKELRETDA